MSSKPHAGSRDLEGRVFVVTGANTGIGRITSLELARRGGHVVLACRTESKARPVIDEIRRDTGNDKVEFLSLDLADLDAVRRSADEFLARDLALHVLVNNAGLAGQRGATSDGFELAFGVNHLGHFLFTLLLMPRLRASTPSRIVNVSSRAHYRAKGIDYDALTRPTASYTAMPEYNVSKLANVLFTAELARRLEGTGVTSYALHPGVVASDIWKRVPGPFRWLIKRFMISNEEGAQTSLHCAADPSVASETGLYYDKSAHKRPSRLAHDAALARELWERSEAWCKVTWDEVTAPDSQTDAASESEPAATSDQ